MSPRRLSLASAVMVALVGRVPAEDMPTFVGPAMGTTYRVTLAAPLVGMTAGEVHREIAAVLARIDRAASTWREDADASRFNRSGSGEWLEVADDLVAIVEIARTVHGQSHGAFDITAALPARPDALPPDGTGHEPRTAAGVARAGIESIRTRSSGGGRRAALLKTRDSVAIDLGGIGPGYAVDEIGARLGGLGSRAHLVELGGEVRAWGRPPGDTGWRVLVRPAGGVPRVIELADGAAVAASTLRPGRSPIDPRTGRPVAGDLRTVVARAESCARADAWAVAAVVLGLDTDTDGFVTAPPAPSTTTDRPAARPTVP